jgi:hypothetical protein
MHNSTGSKSDLNTRPSTLVLDVKAKMSLGTRRNKTIGWVELVLDGFKFIGVLGDYVIAP